ncbi:MAG TPA: TerC family protein [Bauldia sp.]|nr:TerC family protein [Bauldia sp.]
MPGLYSELTAFFTVVFIDLVLAGDNAVVVGMAASGLENAHMRRKAILLGIGAAAILRILFALFATQLLAVIGLTLAGGILLLWVAWKLAREIWAHHTRHEQSAEQDKAPPKTLRRAFLQIVVADISMSLDNVLAVAGAAREHLVVLVFGLALSVGLMGAAATLIARLLQRFFWISYLGLALIAWVAISMIWEGGWEIMEASRPEPQMVPAAAGAA